MPKPKTTETMAFVVSIKAPVEMKPREAAALIREAVGELDAVTTVRVTQIKEA